VSYAVIYQQTHKLSFLSTFVYIHFSFVLFYNLAEKRKRLLFVYYSRTKEVVFSVNVRVIPLLGSEIALFYGCDFYYIHLHN